MPRFASKQVTRVDVLVLGDHPSAFLVAALLKVKAKLRVVQAALASKADDRLVTLNPELFELHPLLSDLCKNLSTNPIHGLQFLADQSDTRSEHRAKPVTAHVARYSQVCQQIENIADANGVETLGTQSMKIHEVDEHGLVVTLGKYQLNPLAMVVACDLPADQKSMLGIPDSWGHDVVHRFTSVRCKTSKHLNLNDRQLMPMSLDLHGKLCWGWLIPGDGEFELVVEQPISMTSAKSGADLLLHWIRVLQSHGVLGSKFDPALAAIKTVDRPLAGALAQEGVANRTLLVGPAGGFYSACAEEIYPCCWSALYAAEVLKKALKEPHLQDALNPYRQNWRTTLGDYLRGPQQNLRFLLPLVYRNPAMTSRITEAILLSKSVVR